MKKYPRLDGLFAGFTQIEGEERGHAGGRVVASPAGERGQLAYDGPGAGVEDDGAVVGEDEQVAVGGEVDEGVQVVLHIVGGVPQELEVGRFGVLLPGLGD